MLVRPYGQGEPSRLQQEHHPLRLRCLSSPGVRRAGPGLDVVTAERDGVAVSTVRGAGLPQRGVSGSACSANSSALAASESLRK